MPPLINPRHERFCQALFEGEPASTAYAKAGYAPNDGNAIRLKGNDRIKARLAELQEAAAASTQVTVQSLIAELEAVRKHASDDAQWGSACKAILGKASIAGLSAQHIKVSHEYHDCPDTTVEAIAAWTAANWELGSVQLNEMQKREFGLLMRDVVAKIEDFLAPIRAASAKTVPAISPPKPISETERRRSLGLINSR
jgi:hypothetical protein